LDKVTTQKPNPKKIRGKDCTTLTIEDWTDLAGGGRKKRGRKVQKKTVQSIDGK